MGLLIKLNNNDTNLKSLKFGQDGPGGGDSGQPYIQKPIPSPTNDNIPNVDDFLLRGGLDAPKTALEDIARLTKYMFDGKSPKGALFVTKQNLLSRIAPKTEASKGTAYAGGALNSGVYTPLSTLAQAGVGFLGEHLDKQGIDPTGAFPTLSLKKYEDVIKSQTSDDFKDTNRLVLLDSLIKEGNTSNLGFDLNYTLNKGNSVIEYDGGPGSILGIGKTNIRFADQRTGKNNPNIPKNFFTDSEIGDFSIFQRQLPSDVNNNNLLGASKAEGLIPEQNFLSDGGQFVGIGNQKRYFGPHLTTQPSQSRNPTIKPKSNPTGQDLSGSSGYQVKNNLKYQTQKTDSTYYSPIENKLNNLYNRQLLSPPQFYDGTWRATNNNIVIPGYSSRNTLIRDNTDAEVSAARGGLWKEFNTNAIQHISGYLADLDKNAGTWATDGVTYINNNNAYPGGIAPDFRKTPRQKRGLYPLAPTAQNPDQPNGLPGYGDMGKGETYSKYITDGNSLANNTLQNIYHASDNSSFIKSNNPFDPNTGDIIPFRIKIINPELPKSDGITLTFRAYIDDFSDSYNADWKAQNYMGRAESFWKYNSFARNVSLGFTVVADNEFHLTSMYDNLNSLASSLAPTYTSQGYMAGNIHEVTVGHYLLEQTGIIQGLTYDIIDESPWDVDTKLPLYIKVTGFKFTPIHTFRPESRFKIPSHRFIN
jgi:hypothetical protein